MHGRRGFLASLLAVPIVARLSGPAFQRNAPPSHLEFTDWSSLARHTVHYPVGITGLVDDGAYGDTIFINAQYDARTATVVPSK